MENEWEKRKRIMLDSSKEITLIIYYQKSKWWRTKKKNEQIKEQTIFGDQPMNREMSKERKKERKKVLFILFYKVSKVGDCCRGRPKGSLFNSFCTEMLGRALPLSLDCSTLPSIRTLYCWVLSKEVSSNIFIVFGMTRQGLNPSLPDHCRTLYPIPAHWSNR